jgi:3',5'-cyclic-AMP phosphodiesterase
MTLTFCAVADLHFGPRGLFEGKLRKLSDQAPALTEQLVRRMNEEVHPQLAIALGDLIQDESHEADLRRYRESLLRLSSLQAPLLVVAGNHDTICLSDDELRTAWQRQGPLFYSLDCGGCHFAVLRTVERTDVDVRLPEEQLEWLERDLAATSLPTVVAMHHSAADQDLTGNPWFAKAPHLALVANRKRLRSLIASSGKVILVINGHVHWNHISVHDGIPYVTVQSLTENVDDDAPGRAANAVAIVTLERGSVRVIIDGAAPTRYEHHRE